MSPRLVPVQHRLIGRVDQVEAVLRAAQARGHLLGVGPAEALGGRRVAVTVTLLQPPVAAVRREARKIRWRKLRHAGLLVLVWAVVVAAVAGLGELGLLIYRWVTHHHGYAIALGVLLFLGAGAVTAAHDANTTRGRQ